MFPLAATLFWLALCACQDLRRRRVDNLLTLGGAAVAAAWLLLQRHSLNGHGVALALLAAALGLLLTLPGYLLGKLGAADVKLLPALGLASDPLTLLYSFALACLVSVALMLACKLLLAAQVLPAPLERRLQPFTPSTRKSFPFLFAVFIGYLLQLPLTGNFPY